MEKVAIVVLRNEVPVVSHKTIADMTQNAEHSITRIIRRNMEDFEDFGGVGFEIHTQKTKGGKQEIKEYFLNEQQATLLMTYLRNNAVVKEFKKNLVRAFYSLKEKSQLPTSSRLMSQGVAIPNVALKADDLGQFALAVWQGIKQIQERMEAAEEEYQEKINTVTNLLKEQHDIIGELTEENQRLTKENYELKDDPASMLMQSLKLATGREVQLSLWPTTHANDNTHSTIKGFCAEHKIKLAHGDSIRFANIIKKLCKEAGEKIPKIPDKQYGTLNIYPRYLLANAVKFL